MSAVHEIATVTSKGQITLPKPIRQALGVNVGSKVVFQFKNSQVVVSRAEDTAHHDPAIAGFLALLEKDIESGKRVTALPDKLARSMVKALKRRVDMHQEIEGDVAL